MDWLGPTWVGVLDGLGTVVVMTVALLVVANSLSLPDPSHELFRDLAQFGAALFIAYSVATAGAGFSTDKIDEHLNWLGSICAVGACGLLGIGASIALAAYREAGHASTLDIVGLCWVVASLTLMGALVAVLPYAVYSWNRSARE